MPVNTLRLTPGLYAQIALKSELQADLFMAEDPVDRMLLLDLFERIECFTLYDINTGI